MIKAVVILLVGLGSIAASVVAADAVLESRRADRIAERVAEARSDLDESHLRSAWCLRLAETLPAASLARVRTKIEMIPEPVTAEESLLFAKNHESLLLFEINDLTRQLGDHEQRALSWRK